MKNNMEPLVIYNQLKTVPDKYLKKIEAGRLKGMSDIKPQWRIEKLTEIFGPCGIGWKVYDVDYSYFTQNNETVVNCRMKFAYKWGEEWSDPIPVSGGSKISTVEKNGTYVSDEAEKMAYTDALSVAGKMIGLASDVYMGHGGKYDNTNKKPSQGQNTATQEDKKKWFNLVRKDGSAVEASQKYVKDSYAKGFNSAQIIKALELEGYSVYSTTKAQIESMANDKYEEIDLEEVPF